MSYYYTYYLARRNRKDGIVEPCAPFDENGKMMSLLCRSRSFASDLWQSMDLLGEDKMSDALKKEFTYKDWNDDEAVEQVRVLPVDKLSAASPFKCAYVPVFDVVDGVDPVEVGFSDKLSPEQFAAFAQAYAADHKNTRKIERYDIESDSYKVVELTPGEYMYYRWVEDVSAEYESWLLMTMFENLGERFWRHDDEVEYVILETEG